MKLLKCVIVDDEPPALRLVKEYIEKIPYMSLLAEFDNGIDALGFLRKEQADVLFLDIKMESLSGIDLLKLLKTNKPHIILTTAYDTFALEAFNLEVDDYLLKPYSFERFLQATEKIYALYNQDENNKIENKENNTFFFVKTENRIQRIDIDSIIFIEGLKEYLIINTTYGKVLTLQSFQDILTKLPDHLFCRVHKSYIVAINKIDHVRKNRISIGERILPIGPTYKDYFLNKIIK